MGKKKTENISPVRDGGNIPKYTERAKEIFKTHHTEELYFTSDGEAFICLSYAQVHAKSLKDNRIETIKKQ